MFCVICIRSLRHTRLLMVGAVLSRTGTHMALKRSLNWDLYFSDLDPFSFSTPKAFCHTHPYNHARSLPLYRSPIRALGVLIRFWVQVTVSLLKPPQCGFRSEAEITCRCRSEAVKNYTITAICNGHSPTDASFRSVVTVM
jgi:hypothetical protein